MFFLCQYFVRNARKKHIICIGEEWNWEKSVIQIRCKILSSFFLNPLVYVQLAILCKRPPASFQNPLTMLTSYERNIAYYNYNSLVLRVVIEYVWAA